jgi:hypothetical protein
MSEKIKFQVARGVDGMCLYMNDWRAGGEKPLCEVKPLYTFSVDRNRLIYKLFTCDLEDRITKQNFTKYENYYTYTLNETHIKISKLHDKLKHSKWILEINKGETFISKISSTFSSCIDELPFFLGIMR